MVQLEWYFLRDLIKSLPILWIYCLANILGWLLGFEPVISSVLVRLHEAIIRALGAKPSRRKDPFL